MGILYWLFNVSVPPMTFAPVLSLTLPLIRMSFPTVVICDVISVFFAPVNVNVLEKFEGLKCFLLFVKKAVKLTGWPIRFLVVFQIYKKKVPVCIYFAHSHIFTIDIYGQVSFGHLFKVLKLFVFPIV